MTQSNRLLLFDPDLKYTTKCFRGRHKQNPKGCKGNFGRCDCYCHRSYQ